MTTDMYPRISLLEGNESLVEWYDDENILRERYFDNDLDAIEFANSLMPDFFSDWNDVDVDWTEGEDDNG